MEGASDEEEEPLDRIGGIAPASHRRGDSRGLAPADGAEEAVEGLRLLCRQRHHRVDARRIAGAERQRSDGEHFTGLAMLLKLRQRDLPAALAGDAQPVHMRLDALVEARQMAAGIMRRVGGAVALTPEEGRFLGVLLDDGLDDRPVAIIDSAHQLRCTEPPLMRLAPVE